MQLYQKEDNKELKQSMISALGSMGAGDALLQIVKTEKDPATARPPFDAWARQRVRVRARRSSISTALTRIPRHARR